MIYTNALKRFARGESIIAESRIEHARVKARENIDTVIRWMRTGECPDRQAASLINQCLQHDGMQRCPRCNDAKPFDRFHQNASICRDCLNAAKRKAHEQLLAEDSVDGYYARRAQECKMKRGQVIGDGEGI